MDIEIQIPDPEFLAAVVTARDVTVGPSDAELARRLDEIISRRSTEDFPPPLLKNAIRDMLRKGGFRPSGRNKPASEYLAQAARESRFPRINNLVDINNLLSLESGLPISLLDCDALGSSAQLRYGREGERYIFNPAGQEIDLSGLVCVCRSDGMPLGSPIKDSMSGKIKDQTRHVLGVVYASARAVSEPTLQSVLAEFERLLIQHAAARQIQRQFLGFSSTPSD